MSTWLLPILILLTGILGRKTDGISNINETRGCTGDNQTYIVNVHFHVQKDVMDAILSLAAKLDGSLIDEVQGVAGEKAWLTAVKSYLGTIMDDVNEDMKHLNIQFNLIIEPQELEQLSSNGAYDPSCELASPVKERTANSYASLSTKIDSGIGIHVYLYGCVYVNPEFDKIYVLRKSNCGRVIGVLWNGSDKTRTLLKSAIMEGLTGSKDVYAEGFLNIVDKNLLCGFCEKCIGLSPTVHGQLVDYRKEIRYIYDNVKVY